MRLRSLGRAAATLAGGTVALTVAASTASAAGPVGAPSNALPAATADCAQPSFSQALQTFKDNNWYTLAPGETDDNFQGDGWTLTGGASLTTATLADGQTGTVLNLPAGAMAVSPTICITSAYPTARAMVRDVTGPPGLAYGVGTSLTAVQASGNIPGNTHWALSPPLNLRPANTTGWQEVHFAFTATGKNTDYQIYNLYLDPRCMG